MSIYGNDSILTINDINAINEAYIGKTPTLLEIEKKIGQLRKNITMFNLADNSPIVLSINRLFEKQFGMELFSLKLLATREVDAYCYSVGLHFDMIDKEMRKFVIGDINNGYKFIKGNGLCTVVCISYGLLADENLSNGEIVSVILHEIGHNFADCIYNQLELYNRNIMSDLLEVAVVYSLYSSLMKDYDMKTKMEIEKRRQKQKPSKFINVIRGLYGRREDNKNTLNQIIVRIFGGYKGIKSFKAKASISDEFKDIKSNMKRRSEVIADKFPVIYGYGVESSTMLLYFQSQKSKAADIIDKYLWRKARISSFKFDTECLDLSKYDEHPDSLQRVFSNIKDIKFELAKDNIDPKLKKVLEDQLSQLEDIIKKATTVTKEMTNREKARARYYSYLANNEQDGIEKEIEDEIENILDDVLNNKK